MLFFFLDKGFLSVVFLLEHPLFSFIISLNIKMIFSMQEGKLTVEKLENLGKLEEKSHCGQLPSPLSTIKLLPISFKSH